MKKTAVTILLSAAIPSLTFANHIGVEGINISNHSNAPISFIGDTGICVGQTSPLTIRTIQQNELKNFCKAKRCRIDMFASYSCTGLREYSFEFDNDYGVGVFKKDYAIHLQAEGFQQNIFITSK